MNVKPRLLAVPRGLIETIAKLAGKGAVTGRLFGSLQVDIQKSRKLLNWSPPYSLSDGLRITIAADPKT
jgi:nucleoside-diphosphate-sugar epimerase